MSRNAEKPVTDKRPRLGIARPPKGSLLAVAQWPLGGIRTYMRYVYKHLSADFRITIVASSTSEDAALVEDAREVGADLVIHGGGGRTPLAAAVFKELLKGKHDFIQSHGFISAAHCYAANLAFRVPHILTVHGILEEKYFKGRLAGLKRAALSRVIRGSDVVYGVSADILAHLEELVPGLEGAGCRKVVIHNGIEAGMFRALDDGGDFRRSLGVDSGQFLFGFLGRFMQQKGFNYLIDAACELKRGKAADFKILAVGSGDYHDWYRRQVTEKGLDDHFIFIPFQRDLSAVYSAIDAVVMPSVWEASGLLAMESLCHGKPLVASDCIGLRETVRGTPALVFESGNAKALSERMRSLLERPMKDAFRDFRPRARGMYDVRKTAQSLGELLQGLSKS
jgi:glycosyltransferase involved in cell wall biosynthesis